MHGAYSLIINLCRKSTAKLIKSARPGPEHPPTQLQRHNSCQSSEEETLTAFDDGDDQAAAAAAVNLKRGIVLSLWTLNCHSGAPVVPLLPLCSPNLYHLTQSTIFTLVHYTDI